MSAACSSVGKLKKLLLIQKNYFDLPDVPHFHFVKLKG